MSYDEFVQAVAERASLEQAEAGRTATVVLQALCDRLTGDEAFDLLAPLPARLKTAVTITQAPTRWTPEQFVERVAEQLEIEPGEARERIRAVFATIREAVPLGEFRDVLEQLDPATPICLPSAPAMTGSRRAGAY